MWRAVVSQPLDRTHSFDALGKVDTEAGEFWVNSPFQMPQLGHNLSAYEENRLFINAAGSQFLEASFASQANIDSDSRSVVATDMNGDGAADLLVGSVGGGPLRLFVNRIPSLGHQVKFELEGTASNRAAIGTRLILHCGSTTITRDLFPANGFMGQSPVEMRVGVGAATSIDELMIRWPSGETQTFRDVPVDCRLQIREGQTDYRSLSF